MFGLFNDPFGGFGYAPRHVVRAYDPFFGYYYKPVRRNYDPFGINSLGAYMHAMDQAFNQMFGYYDDEEEEKSEVPKKENQEEPKAELKEETPKTEEKVEKKAPVQKAQKVQKKEQQQYWSRSSVFSSHSKGGIEEIREKTYDSKTGETIESQTRRIEDRWCRIDTTTDKEGVSKSKETWHNVADDEMEHFKKEWVSRRGLNSKPQNTKAIEEKKDEKKEDNKEEKKPEEVKTENVEEKKEEKSETQ